MSQVSACISSTAMNSIVSFLVSLLFVAVLGDKCLDCMCQLESRGCNAIGCNMDQGSLSCGYFQIKLAYYQDCGQPWKEGGESTEHAWQRCANNWDCSVQCIHNYIGRYGGNCPGRSDCERMARLHNGGPYGCNGGTDWYWGKIKQCLG